MTTYRSFEETALDALEREGEEEWDAAGAGWDGELTGPLDAFTPAERKALLVTNLFETGHRDVLGFDGITGDFDDQGISFGVLQWNIGTGSLQVLLRKFRRDHPDRFAAIFEGDAAAFASVLEKRKGEDERQALARQLAWARTVADRRGVHEPWLGRFRRLGADPAFQAIEVASIRERMDRARDYLRELGFGSERALVLMFDLVTQQGMRWLDRKGANRRARLRAAWAAKESELRRPLTEREKLEQIARVVADTVRPQYRDRVLLRKRAIVDGTIRVHGLKAGLDATFGVSDAPLGGAALLLAAAPAAAAGRPGGETRVPSAAAPLARPPAKGAGPQLSPLAVVGRKLRKGRARRVAIYGIVVHTTGSGPAEKARKSGKPAIGFALRYYVDGDGGFPHYVVDYDGTIHAVCDEREVAWHAGWGAIGGKSYFAPPWKAPEWWRKAWSGWKVTTPVDLLAAGVSDPNTATIGIEVLGAERDRRFTDAQYAALARLVRDIRDRNALHIPSAPAPTLLGHEDVNPISKAEAVARFGMEKGGRVHRADARGGWDPGAHRSDPRFDWSRVWSEMQQIARELHEVA